MKNSYVCLYKMDFTENQFGEIQNIVKKIISYFYKLKKENNCKKVLDFNLFEQLECQEFFLIEYKTKIFFLLKGQKILRQGWNYEIKKILMLFISTYIVDVYIEQNLKQNKKNVLKSKQNTPTKCQLEQNYVYPFLDYCYTFQDYTYWNKNPDIKVRRLRSESGALRRILYDIKFNTKEEKLKVEKKSTHYYENIQFHGILGNKERLEMIYLAVQTNKKIFKQEKIEIPLNSAVNKFGTESKKATSNILQNNSITILNDDYEILTIFDILENISKDTKQLTEVSSMVKLLSQNTTELTKKLDINNRLLFLLCNSNLMKKQENSFSEEKNLFNSLN